MQVTHIAAHDTALTTGCCGGGSSSSSSAAAFRVASPCKQATLEFWMHRKHYAQPVITKAIPQATFTI